jgi:ATP synthase F1 gamma subunit
MRKINELAQEEAAMLTMVKLTSVFEGIASMHISQIKNQVLQAQQFFNELWHMYTQLQVDVLFKFGHHEEIKDVIDKELFIIITAEGGFSGDIDQKLIKYMLKEYHPDKQDIIVVGHHGVIQLAQQSVSFKRYYKLPDKDSDINVLPLIRDVQHYRTTTVFYQTYVSLMIQDVKRINLGNAVEEQGKAAGRSAETINENTYIFEPSTFAVVDHLESSMMQIMLSQVILESKLAQYASRFRAMSVAHDRADDTAADLQMMYNRAKRAAKDERLKEINFSLRSTRLV